MKFSGAVAALEAGKKVKFKFWNDDHYIDPNPPDYSCPMEVNPLDANEPLKPVRLSWAFMEGDWEIYEEPGHDFQWALEQIKKGNKPIRRSWKIYQKSLDSQWVTFGDMAATDWVLSED